MSRNVILRNTLFSYGRTFVAAAMGIFTSRWLLADLGASDYGLCGVVGSLLIVIDFLQNTIGQGSDRFLAYAIGGRDFEKVKDWFNTACNLFVVVPLLIAPLGFIMGELVVRYMLKIPDGRMNAALWVMRFSILSIVISFSTSVYRSMLLAKQYIHFVSMVSLLRNAGLFLIAFMLQYLPDDHLIFYAGLSALTVLGMNMVYVCVCRRMCLEARIDFNRWWNVARIKSFFSFSGWISFGSLGTVIRTSGIGVLLNWMAGASANAGLSVAHTLSSQMQTLSQSFLMAVSPEVARRAGAGEREAMILLARRSMKLGMLLFLLVGVPLFCECETVLNVWLVEVPPYATFLARIAIVEAFLCKFAFGHRMCFNALGRVRGRNIIEFSFLTTTVLVLGLSYFAVRSIEIAFVCSALVWVVYVFANVLLGERSFGWKTKDFLAKLFFPVIFMSLFGLAIHAIFIARIAPSILRVFLTVLLIDSLLVVLAYVVLLEAPDRHYLKAKIFRRIGLRTDRMMQDCK